MSHETDQTLNIRITRRQVIGGGIAGLAALVGGAYLLGRNTSESSPRQVVIVSPKPDTKLNIDAMSFAKTAKQTVISGDLNAVLNLYLPEERDKIKRDPQSLSFLDIIIKAHKSCIDRGYVLGEPKQISSNDDITTYSFPYDRECRAVVPAFGGGTTTTGIGLFNIAIQRKGGKFYIAALF